MPVHRPNSQIRQEISTEYIKLVITSEGKIEKCPYKLTARKYSLFEMREMENGNGKK